MIDDLKPYPQMKDSGVPCLGDVPQQWGVHKLRGLLRRVTERCRPDLPLLSVVREMGVIRRNTADQGENRNFIPEDLSNYKVVRLGQFAMNKMKAWQGSYGISPTDGIVSPAYFVFSLEGADPHFFHAAIRSRAYVPSFAQASDGVRIGQWDLVESRMREIPFALPPLPEQAAIVRFLGHADRRIRRYIRAKQKLTKLLEEQKQALIHRAVTRGLDPNVRLKPSGIDWLGDIPEHWQLMPLRRRWSVTDCKHLTVPFVEHGVPLASVREVQSFDLRLNNAKRTTDEWFRVLTSGDRQPKRGDLIYCRNVSVGAAAVVETDAPLAMGQDVCLIRSAGENQRFLNYFLHSPAMRNQLAQQMVGSTFDRINISEVKALLVVVPPREEQDAIASHLDGSLRGLDRVALRLGSEQDLLREYRTRLIADVVTGKLDVREAAARLPDEPDAADGPEPLDEVEPDDGADDGDTDDLAETAQEAEA